MTTAELVYQLSQKNPDALSSLAHYVAEIGHYERKYLSAIKARPVVVIVWRFEDGSGLEIPYARVNGKICAFNLVSEE